jgi:hypothetical protein
LTAASAYAKLALYIPISRWLRGFQFMAISHSTG